MFETILEYCDRIKNGRTEDDILDALFEEHDELDKELQRFACDGSSGEDGIIGEAIDILLCAVDYERKKNSITAEELEAIVKRKLDKWERVYG